MIDLQLPGQDQVEYTQPIQQEEEPKEKTEFKEKTVTSLHKEKSNDKEGFKKRKNVNEHKRNIRRREDDD